jgi:WG containing repeat
VRTAITTLALLLVIAANAAGQDTPKQSPKQPTRPGSSIPDSSSGVHSAGAAGTPCLFDLQRGEVPNCLRESATGELFIAPQLVKDLQFEAYGLAAVLSPKRGWMYVSRTGRVVVSGVPVMDNWADSFHEGLVRIVRNGRYGFANRRGQIVIPPVYDGAMNFEKGRAAVCKGCTDTCVGEYHLFKGGEWFQINTKGTVLARLHPNE